MTDVSTVLVAVPEWMTAPAQADQAIEQVRRHLAARGRQFVRIVGPATQWGRDELAAGGVLAFNSDHTHRSYRVVHVPAG